MIFVYKRCIIRCTAYFSCPLPFPSNGSGYLRKGIRPAVLKRPHDRAIRARAYAPAVLKRPRDRAIRARPYGPPFSNVRAIEPSVQGHATHLSHRQPDHITHAKSPLPFFPRRPRTAAPFPKAIDHTKTARRWPGARKTVILRHYYFTASV